MKQQAIIASGHFALDQLNRYGIEAFHNPGDELTPVGSGDVPFFDLGPGDLIQPKDCLRKVLILSDMRDKHGYPVYTAVEFEGEDYDALTPEHIVVEKSYYLGITPTVFRYGTIYTFDGGFTYLNKDRERVADLAVFYQGIGKIKAEIA